VTVGAHQRLCADTPASAPEAPGRALGRQRSTGPMATHAMHSSAGVHGGACDVQAADGCPTAKQLGRRSEAELLVELEAPSCEIPTREARVLEPQLGRRAHGAGEDQLAKAGGEGRSAPRSGPRLRRWAGRGAAGRACRRTGCACRWARVRGRARCADRPPSSAWPGRARRALSAPASRLSPRCCAPMATAAGSARDGRDSADHIVRVRAGGSDDLVNLRAAHWSGNRRRG
jgi:hypothetical protein